MRGGVELPEAWGTRDQETIRVIYNGNGKNDKASKNVMDNKTLTPGRCYKVNKLETALGKYLCLEECNNAENVLKIFVRDEDYTDILEKFTLHPDDPPARYAWLERDQNRDLHTL